MEKKSERGINRKFPPIQGRKRSAGIQPQGNGTQLQAAGFVLAVEITVSIQVIPKDRMAKCGKMSADLMGPSGDQLDPQAGNSTAFKRLLSGRNRTGVGYRMIRYTDNCVPAVFNQECTADRSRRLHYTADQADIILLNRPFSEGLLHDFQRMSIPGKQT